MRAGTKHVKPTQRPRSQRATARHSFSPPVSVVLDKFESLLTAGLETVLWSARDIELTVVGDSAALESSVARTAPCIAIVTEDRAYDSALMARLRAIKSVIVIVLADRPTRVYMMRVQAAGAICITQDTPRPEFVDAIRYIAAGTYSSELVCLTPREQDVLDCICMGQTYTEVAKALRIDGAPRTSPRPTRVLGCFGCS
jgi:DNA-binding NarL/FixJ family response regulator